MNLYPSHIVQSIEWGRFKTAMGTRSVRVGNIQFTLHKIPFTKNYVGYCPKINPTDLDLESLYESGKKHNCTHIKIDVPNTTDRYQISDIGYQIVESNPTFATSTFMLDLSKSEDELLKNMHHKTRYNIHLAERRGVTVEKSEDIDTFLTLQRSTAERQGFKVHPDEYYKTLFKMFKESGKAYLLKAVFNKDTLASYFLLKYKDTFYYPYGGSSEKHKNVMANNLIMWETIKLGKNVGCKVFDMWGALEEPADRKNPWYGFHRFKKGYGATHVQFPGAWDLVIKPIEYKLFRNAEALRWKFLKTRR